jgi:predicted nucleotidyltransferase
MHVRGLQRATGLAPRSLQTELVRLGELGVIQREASGRQVRYRVNEQSPRWRLVRELVRELADPTDVVRDALSDVSGLEAAFVFGSVARGTEIREGSDIDLFVLRGELAEDRFARRTIDAGVLLKREVNPVVMGAEELRDHVSKESGFLRAVLSEPKRWVAGDERALHWALAGQAE